MDFKIKLYKNNFGIIGKLNLSKAETFGGVGIFAGFGKD